MGDDELTHAATDYAVGGRGPACRKRCSSCVNMAFRRGAEWERERADREVKALIDEARRILAENASESAKIEALRKIATSRVPVFFAVDPAHPAEPAP